MSATVLLNAADDCLADYMTPREFEESLILNVLFHERIVVHEAFFFDSPHLHEHLRSAPHGLSVFEEAARRGIVAPAFRDPDTNRFGMRFRSCWVEVSMGGD